MNEFDAFISYASEDKEAFALPLAQKLRSVGLNVWFDDFCLKVGDSLRKKIDYGLSNSRYGIVILSRHFFEKQWPQNELNALYSLEIDGRSAILPVWNDIGRIEVRKYSPLLADKYTAQAYEGVDKVAAQLVEVIDPSNDYPSDLLQEKLSQIEPEKYPGFDVRVKWGKDYKLVGTLPFYDTNKSYISITVSNWGTREVVISKAGLHYRRRDKPYEIAADSLLFGPRSLKDGEKADYLIEQEAVQNIDLIDYAWAIDRVGREWRSKD